jgi:membrane-associated phospholipid phosphatase
VLNDIQCFSELVLAVQGLGAWLTVPMRILSYLGNGALYLLIACALSWNADTRAGLRLGSLFLLSSGLNSIVKLACHTPRPYWCDPRVLALSTETSFGFPSGHAQHAVAICLGLALIVAKGRNWIPAALLALLIGLSRIYLGVHSTGDVIGGWLLGGLILWAYLRVETLAGTWWARQGFAIRWLVISTLFVVLLYLGIGARLSVGDWRVPAEWVANAARANPEARPIAPLRLSDTIYSLGAFWGLAVGDAWLATRGSYSTLGSRRQHGLRYLVGALGLLFLGLGPYLLLPHAESWTLHMVRLLISTLVGLWISGLAPLAFVRLGLAQFRATV